MTVTAVGCMPETTAITRRGFRGYEEHSTAEASTTSRLSLPRPKHHTKRQTAVSPISGSGLPLQAQQYLTQLNTAIFIIDLINTSSDLSGDCQDLRNGNATLSAAVAINATQAADFVCAAYATNLTSISPTLLQVFAAALYAVELSGNFAGTTNTTTLCDSVDVDILTLPIFGVDGQGVQSYVCNAFNATQNMTFTTVTSSIATSAGTITPLAWGNRTSFGTGPLITGPVRTGPSIGTGVAGWPFGNITGAWTRSFTGPRTGSGSGNPQPIATGSLRSSISGFPGESGSGPDGVPTGVPAVSDPGYIPPTGTGLSGGSYSGLPGFSTGSGLGYGQPSGTGVSGWPYGNLTVFPTGYGSGYAGPSGTGFSGLLNGAPTGFLTRSGPSSAQPTGPGGSDDPSSIQFTSSDPSPTARLPPDPSASHFYPAISPSASPAVFYGYGYGYRD